MKKRQTKNQIWDIPVILGFLTFTGLISALVLDKAGDVISWITLLVSVIVTIRFCFLKHHHSYGNKKW